MIQEQKDLLLKDLCMRLPYKVKVEIKNVSKICTLEEIDCNDDEMSVAVKHENGELSGYDFDLAKPYLFPLSSMTEEQKEELSLIACDLNDSDTWRNGNIIYIDNSYQLNELLNFYHKNHLDYRGLISLGLAIDATGLNIY